MLRDANGWVIGMTMTHSFSTKNSCLVAADSRHILLGVNIGLLTCCVQHQFALPARGNACGVGFIGVDVHLCARSQFPSFLRMSRRTQV